WNERPSYSPLRRLDGHRQRGAAPARQVARIAPPVFLQEQRASHRIFLRVRHRAGPALKLGSGTRPQPDGDVRIGLEIADPVGPTAAPRQEIERISVLAHPEPDLDLVQPAGPAPGRDQVAIVRVCELWVERQRMTQNTRAKTAA